MPGAQCCVGGCINKRERNVSLHKFPKDSNLKEKWVKAVQSTGTCFSRSGWSGPKSKSEHSQLVCSEHFVLECFTLTSRLHWQEGLPYKAKLEISAVPTLFGQQIDDYKQREPVLRRAFRKRECARIIREYDIGTTQSVSVETEDNSASSTALPQHEYHESACVSRLSSMPENEAEIANDTTMKARGDHEFPCDRLSPNQPLDDPAIPTAVCDVPVSTSCSEVTDQDQSSKSKPKIVKEVTHQHKSTQVNLKTKKVETNTKRTQTLTKHHTAMASSSSQYNSNDVGSSSFTPVKHPLQPKSVLNSPGLNTTFSSYTSSFRDNNKDTDYNPADETFSTDAGDVDEELLETDPKSQRKFLVFEDNLMSLFQVCPECSHASSSSISQIQGSYVAVRQECLCGFSRRWESQPKTGNIPAGNILLSAAVLFSGCNPTKLFRAFGFLNFVTISMASFYEHQKSILWPAIDRVWNFKKSTLFSALRRCGGKVVIAGDGRADSPGHSAKYGAYSMIDLKSGYVIDIQLVQSNEVKSSYHMELEGLKRAVANLKKEQITITEIITDRHLQIQKWIRENLFQTRHSFDVWHIAKGIKKKLLSVAKEKDCGIVFSWIKSITNHVYWSAASSKEGDEEIIIDKWKSVANHIQNVHCNHGGKFSNCLHDELDGRDWLKPGTKACVKVEDIILNKRLCKDVGKMSTNHQTSTLEAFHSVINHFAPKLNGFSFNGQLCRQHLAALHFNENVNRKVALRKNGEKRIKITFPKFKMHDDYSIKVVREKMTFQYVDELIDESLALCSSEKKEELSTPVPPALTSIKRKPCKVEALSKLTSRFKKIKKCLDEEFMMDN